jgi:integrase
MKPRHRVATVRQAPDRASDAQALALLKACRSARDRLLVLLLGRAGLRRGEVVGLRRADVHFLIDSLVRRQNRLGGRQPRSEPSTSRSRVARIVRYWWIRPEAAHSPRRAWL